MLPDQDQLPLEVPPEPLEPPVLDPLEPLEPVPGVHDQPQEPLPPVLEPDHPPLPDDDCQLPQPPLPFQEPFHDQLWARASWAPATTSKAAKSAMMVPRLRFCKSMPPPGCKEHQVPGS